jgi:predicted anti-sigma-YlaC factor YlaD
MSHRQFERWVLDPGPLPPEQSRELAEHLAGCAACRALQDSWAQAARVLRADVGLLAPAAGFGRRWLERQQAAVRAAHARQATLALAWMAGGALAGTAALVVALAVWLGSPVDLAAGALRRALELWLAWKIAWGLGGALLSSLPAPAPYAAAGGLCVLLAALSGLWGWIVFRYSPQPILAASGGLR